VKIGIIAKMLQEESTYSARSLSYNVQLDQNLIATEQLDSPQLHLRKGIKVAIEMP
jgi:hypothetical protein